MIMEINERVCRYLAACPPAISGQEGHNRTFAVACALVNGFGLSESEALRYLSFFNERCQPPWSDGELAHKIKSAVNAQHSKPRGHLAGEGAFKSEDYKASSFPVKVKTAETPKAVIDPSTAIEIFLRGFKCSESDVFEASPVKPSDDWSRDGILLVENIFKKGEIVNFVTDFSMSDTKSGFKKAIPSGRGDSVERDDLLSRWDLMGMPTSDAGGWMRMNPMSGDGIGDKDVTVHRHILLEFDSIPIDLQLSFLARLMLPISCILTSGGKSLHAWVRSDSPDFTSYKDDSVMLLKMLTRFGLDAKNKNPSRLSRLPGVIRKHGASGDGRQRLLYINPSPTQSRILT